MGESYSFEREWMKYSEKLKDPRWQRKRLEILNRDSFTCQYCGDTKSTLNVHHKQYHGNPWDAPSESLETLCESCHAMRTGWNKDFLSLSAADAGSLFYHAHLYEQIRDIVNPKKIKFPDGPVTVRLKEPCVKDPS